ncbi:MAG: transcriptional repressor [Deltaproteobacteria bacterium]|nr:transcriptional repressor [Deltaproteobacteria bacterium]MBW2661729.1 transcriptional repressor [Deltaproteobacteria bacterium]
MDLKKKIAGLQGKKVTLTIQRHAVLEYLYKNRTHPTVEEIYTNLKAKYSVISKATVYNTLDFLKKHDTIKEITIEKGKARFDYKIEPHHHFFCRKCGYICDLDVKGCALAGKKMMDGHKIEELRQYVIGICSECLKRKKDS